MTARHDSLCLLRTHRFGEEERRQIALLRPAFGDRIAVAADESAGPVECGDIPKVAVTTETLAGLGLRPGPRWGWRCGDYMLTAARAAMPQVRHFWLVEPDVEITHRDSAAFLQRIDASAADLVAGKFGPRPDGWAWRVKLQPHVDTPVHGMFFSMFRASAGAIDAGTRLRHRLDRDMPSGWGDWPNDESVLATAVAMTGGPVSRIEDFLPQDPRLAYCRVKRTAFFRRRHVLSLDLETIFHPVYDDETFFARIAEQLRRGHITEDDARERFAGQMTPAEVKAVLG